MLPINLKYIYPSLLGYIGYLSNSLLLILIISLVLYIIYLSWSIIIALTLGLSFKAYLIETLIAFLKILLTNFKILRGFLEEPLAFFF